MVWDPGGSVRVKEADSDAAMAWDAPWSTTMRYPFESGLVPVVFRVTRIVDIPLGGGGGTRGFSSPQAATRSRERVRNSGRKGTARSDMGPPGVAAASQPSGGVEPGRRVLAIQGVAGASTPAHEPLINASTQVISQQPSGQRTQPPSSSTFQRHRAAPGIDTPG